MCAYLSVPICYEVICSYLLWVKILEILLEDFFFIIIIIHNEVFH